MQFSSSTSTSSIIDTNTAFSILFPNAFGLCMIWGSHSGGYDEFYLLGYNAVLSIESRPKFRRNTLPPFSGQQNKLSKNPA
jgi:hypothetical protein